MKRFLTFICLSLITSFLPAQVINSVRVSHDSIRIGDDILIYHKLSVPPTVSINALDYGAMVDSLKSTSMVTGQAEPADAEWQGRFLTYNDNLIPFRELRQSSAGVYLDTFKLTIYEPGMFTIHPPGIQMDSSSQDISVMEMQLPTVMVGVTQGFASFIEENKDSMSVEVIKRDLSPIRDNIYTPLTWKDNLFKWAIPILLLLLAVGYYVYRKTRPEEKEIVLIEKPTAPAHYHAMKSLDRIHQDELWKKEQEKEYHSDLTHTIRQYLEDRYEIKALGSTTMEIRGELGNKLTQSQQDELNQILQISDLIKFAKATTTDDLNEKFLQRAKALVDETYNPDYDFNDIEYQKQLSAYEEQQRSLS